MNKVIVLTPAYNDWKSLDKLLKEINIYLSKISKNIEVLIVDDCSNTKFRTSTLQLNNIKKIRVLRLKKNIGSQLAIFIGLKYLKKINSKSTIIVMDSDGEDDKNAINKMVQIAKNNCEYVVTGNRLQRSEGAMFTILYKMHLLITFLLTGKYLNFGNFTAFDSKKLKQILKNTNLSIAYSAGIKKNVKNLLPYYTKRKKRYFGSSKVSFFFLFKHALNIITVFKKELLNRSIIILLFIYLINLYLKIKFLFSLSIIIILFNFLVLLNFLNFKKNKKKMNTFYHVKIKK